MLTFFTVLAVLAAAIGAACSFFGLVSPALGALLAAFGVVLLTILFFVAFVGFLRHGSRDTNWTTLFLGLIAFISLGGLGYLFFMNPIKDITTDVRNPPKFMRPAFPFSVEKGAEYLDKDLQLDRDYDQTNAATQLLKYSGFEGLKFKAPPKDVYEEAMKVVREQLTGWRVVLDDKANNRAEFEAVWSPFQFVDDVVMEVRPEPHHDFDAIVEMRSRSRLGISDFGVNIFRLRDLKVRLLLALKPLEDKMLAPRMEWEQKNAQSTGGGEAEKK